MDQRDPYDYGKLNSISIDNDNHDISQEDLWDDDEEIELGSDENELFLKEEYIKPTTNDMLPFRVSASSQMTMSTDPNIKRNGFTKNFGKFRNDDHSGGETKIETFQVDDSGHGSPTPSSVVYQMPNHDQYGGNPTPTSPNSVIVSFIIIFVILAVTIVPKVIPKSQTPNGYDGLDAYDEDVIENSSTSNEGFTREYSHQSVHSDARCKCICPPLLSATGTASVASNTSTKSTTSGDNSSIKGQPKSNSTAISNTSKNITTIANSRTVNQRRLYVGNTLPDQCNCNNIVRAHFQLDTEVYFKEFCARCECRYQSRNTITIKRNVVFFIIVLSGLALYLIVQYLLKHFRITRRSLPPNMRWLSHQQESS